jgi:hypothetical protein
MSKLTQAVLRIILTFSILFTGLASTAAVAYAADGDLEITLAEVFVGECGQVSFSFEWEGGTGNDLYKIVFGDGETTEITTINTSTITIPHTYDVMGDYQWAFTINDVSVSETLTIEGPKVTINSDKFVLNVDETDSVEFSAVVDCPSGNYTYAWDLDWDPAGDFVPDEGETGQTATGTYSEVGKYYAMVEVTDNDLIGYTTSDTIPVVVANPEEACHPMAQTISTGVNLLFPAQSEDLYTCDEILTIFDNETEENNLGFGRMWKAYNLAKGMEELTWEDILDWHLDVGGWGALLQLDRFADLLKDDVTLPELMGLVMSDEYSLGDVRTAVRSVTRYDADFKDTLARILEGVNTGDINQAYKLATDEVLATDILDMGVQAYRESLREEDKAARESLREEGKTARELIREEDKTAKAGEEKQAAQTEEKTQQTAKKLAEQFTAKFGDVMNLFNGECEGDWACVRKTLRDQEQEMSGEYSDKDLQTALQISSKYNLGEGEVKVHYEGTCDYDWACTRAYFRALAAGTKETGKPDKK